MGGESCAEDGSMSLPGLVDGWDGDGDGAMQGQSLPSPEVDPLKVVIIHVGMHKTASTYIQNRLRKNIQLLRRYQLLYPPLRRQHLALLQAVKQRDATAWQDWLAAAESQQCRLFLSAEAFSLELAKPCPGQAPDFRQGSWLRQLLQQRGWRLEVIAFIRDQPSYLNSRYTQLVKRLHTTCSFRRYVQRVIHQGGTESECDMMRLFEWALSDRNVRTTFVPFIQAVPSYSSEPQSHPDPFEKLLQCLPLPPRVSLAPASTRGGMRIRIVQTIMSSFHAEQQKRLWKILPLPKRLRDAFAIESRANQQPGSTGVLVARKLARYLKRHHPDLLARESCRATARDQIERWAASRNWYQQPFNGLTPKLWQEIRAHYAASNAEFATRAWGDGCQWSAIFGERFERPPVQKQSLSDAAEIKSLLKELMRRLQQPVSP